MKTEIKTFGLMLLFGGLAGASPSNAGGIQYEHLADKSQFNVGAGGHLEVQGPYQRLRGDRGAFMVDTVTGATLATLNAPPSPDLLPQPLTQDPDEHSGIVREYLIRAGVPAGEVSGTHVTTTMKGGGSTQSPAMSSPSKLLWYTTHLERSIQGIPVEGSFAFAAFDSNGEVITEGVYWPAIPDGVVDEAVQLKQRLDSPTEKAAFLRSVEAARADAKDAAGEVKIVHTSAGHHGQFEAKAVYSTVVKSRTGGKASLVRFDSGARAVAMADEKATGVDSPRKEK